MAGAVRTCVVCRRSAPRGELVRLVREGGVHVALDLDGAAPGRGVWLHPARACVDAVDREPRRLRGPFKGDVALVTPLGPALRAASVRGVWDAIPRASRAGALVSGHVRLSAALVSGRVLEVLVAVDASADTILALRQVADPLVPFTSVPWTREELGACVRRGPRAALGVLRSSSSAPLLTRLRQERSLG